VSVGIEPGSWVRKIRQSPYEWGTGLVVAAGTFLRLKGLTAQSLWLDELAAAKYTISNSFGGIVRICQNEIHPPLYFFLLRLWEIPFGTGEYALRSFSAAAGIAGIPAVYLLGKELFSKAVGFFAAAITALNIYHISYSQEVRSYGLLFLLTVLSFLAFVRLVRRPGLRGSLAYAAAVTLLLYTHYFGFFVLAAQVAAALFILAGRAGRLPLMKSLAMSAVVVTALYLPWYGQALKLTRATSFWTEHPAPGFFINYFKLFLGYEPLLAVLFSGLLLLYLVSRPEPGYFEHHKLVLLAWMFLTLFLPYWRSFNHPSPLIDRCAIIVLPAIFLAGAAALPTIGEKRARAFLFSVLLVMSLVSLFLTRGNYYRNTTKEPWRDAARFVVDRDPAGKYPVFANPYFDYYLNHIFRAGRDIDPSGSAEDIRRRVEEKGLPGAWVLEGHLVRPEEGVNLASLGRTMVKSASLALYRVRATLFVRPGELEILEGGHVLPLGIFSSNTRPQEQRDDLIIAPWNIQLLSPEISMPAGRYRVRVNARGTEAFGSYARLRVTLDKTERTVELGPADGDYELTADIANPGRYKIILEFDNDAFDEAGGKDRNVWVNRVEVLKSRTP
jgi:hypothetical protein